MDDTTILRELFGRTLPMQPDERLPVRPQFDEAEIQAAMKDYRLTRQQALDALQLIL
jgi:hypothetical protein